MPLCVRTPCVPLCVHLCIAGEHVQTLYTPASLCVPVQENTYSMNLGRKTLYVMQCTEEKDNPLELAFQDQYGAIEKHLWFGDGYILVGFKSGNVSAWVGEAGRHQEEHEWGGCGGGLSVCVGLHPGRLWAGGCGEVGVHL